MPVLKVPVIHKFGIISHYQRLELQARLLSDFSLSKTHQETTKSSKRDPFEISEKFVEKYNSIVCHFSSKPKEASQMKDLAYKMFQKAKRRIGLKYNCENESHTNVALGWTELTILSQCNSNLSMECLDLLYLSLSVAPINQKAFYAQFYLLETALYFLQITEFHQDRPEKHIKWLQIGELVAIRIYIQCKLHLLQCLQENINNLNMYMKDIEKCHKNFEDFPEAAVSFCVIHELYEYLSKCFGGSMSFESQESEHSISSLLWHCADLWNCSYFSSHRPQLKESVASIEHCLMHNISFGNWMDCYLSFRVLASVASFEMVGLETFESVILGLAEVNSELTGKKCNNLDVTTVSNLSTSLSTEICNFEKGSILLFSAVREFCCLPLFSRKSEPRERALSIIAEWLLHRSDINLPPIALEIITARVNAILRVLESSSMDEGVSVIKNAVWSLLETVKRKRIVQNHWEKCLTYSHVISPMIFSSELSANPHLINERIALTLSKFMFSIVESPDRDKSAELKITLKSKTGSSNANEMDKKLDICCSSRKFVAKASEKSNYIKNSDRQLNRILQNCWDTELPELEKNIEESLHNTE